MIMKTKKITYFLFIGIITSAICFTSCKKKEINEKDTDTASASDQSLASSSVNDLTSISDEAGRNYSVQSFKTTDSEGLLATSCAVITVDTLIAAKTITVNFGTSNCLCNDGRNRRGSIILSFNGKYRDSLTVITITPQNYFVNDNQVSGSKTITNKGHNAANHLVYEINANMTIEKANGGGTITWSSIRQREWIAGENTVSWSDDIYSITGTANGTTSNSNSFSSTITSPLIRNMAVGCRKHFTQGILEHTPSGKAMRTIDYGNGTCDDQATVTINGNTYTITLP